MDMIERVARALCRLDGNPENATMDGKPLWRDYETEARAAIGEMMEPTEEMLEAAKPLPAHLIEERDDPAHTAAMETATAVDRLATADTWRTMLTAALGEK